MSIKVSDWAWTVDGLDAGAKLVLLALADHADDTGLCWPSLERLAERTGRNRSTVQRSLRALVGLGLVSSSVGSGRRSTSYWVHYATATDIHTGCVVQALAVDQGRHHATATETRGGVVQRGGVHGAPVVGAPCTPNSYEPSKNPRARRTSKETYAWHGDRAAQERRRVDILTEQAQLPGEYNPNIDRDRRNYLIGLDNELEAIETELASR